MERVEWTKSADGRWTRTRWLLDEETVRRWLATIRPRDCVFSDVIEVADPAIAVRPLAQAPVVALLLAGVTRTGPVLAGLVAGGWNGDAEALALTRFLADRFPPGVPIPAVSDRWLPALRDIAQGEPGDPVAHGLFPSVPGKLARLALARAGEPSARAVRAAALRAYDRGRPYHAHDALACAIVHPGVDAAALVAELTAAAPARGWRSRRKTHRVIRWARDAGHLSG
ncbi:hypothetical protein AB0K60_33490 [Thermopolyspora sp. NPDC052614]|uniref:hypothetical protein n=1 Tax=Thermopolyspora sp. NPDC052614 TaxID=3155682 RepID=UPI0034376F82